MATVSPPSSLQTPPPASPEPDQGADAAIIAALAGVLAGGLGAGATLALVSSVLSAAGIASVVGTTSVASEALRLASQAPLPGLPPRAGSAARTAARTAWSYRAAYLLAAARRLASGARGREFGKALHQERLYSAAHVEAAARRMASARAVDAVAARSGPWLMWHARKDAKTTPECRLADGKTWHVDDPPTIGLPGSGPHVNCRCWVGPGRPGLQTVDEAMTAAGPAALRH